MSANRLRLVVGLGNPGNTYQNTRHNAGFMVADQIAQDFNIALEKTKFDAVYGRGFIEDIDVLLVKPMAFMNRSGPPLQKLAHYFRIRGEDMLVIHDDIDLAFGRIKIKEKGGHGGHNGLKSVMDALGSGDFIRLRIGIGRPARGGDVIDHVLGPFSNWEKEMLNTVLARASDAAATVFCHGAKAGMNRFHRKTMNSPETSDGGKNGRSIK